MEQRSIHARIAEAEDSGSPAALVTVVAATGSTPRSPGARMLVFEDGSIAGTIGGGTVEEQAIAAAKKTLDHGRPQVLEYQLTQQLGMCCGGAVTLFVERIGGQARLIVFGAGHVGTALVRMASLAGFAVHVADEREELLNVERLPDARALHDDLDDPALPFADHTYVLIVTHDHALDQRLVEKVLKKPHAWLGMIGSRRKAHLMRERLAAKGFDPDAISAVRSPVGLSIAAETAEEIAVSILAELITLRREGPRFVSEDGAAVAPLETKAKRA